MENFGEEIPDNNLLRELIYGGNDPEGELERRLTEETERLQRDGRCRREAVLEKLRRCAEEGPKAGKHGCRKLCLLESFGEDCLVRIRANPLAMAVLLKEYELAERLIRNGEAFEKKKCEILYLNRDTGRYRGIRPVSCFFKQEYPNSPDFIYGCRKLPDELRFLYLERHPEDALLGSVPELLDVMCAGRPLFLETEDRSRICEALAERDAKKPEEPSDNGSCAGNGLRVLELFAKRYGSRMPVFSEVRKKGAEAALDTARHRWKDRRAIEELVAEGMRLQAGTERPGGNDNVVKRIRQAHLLLLGSAGGDEPLLYYLNEVFAEKLDALTTRIDWSVLEYCCALSRYAVSDRIRIRLLCRCIGFYGWVTSRGPADPIRGRRFERLLQMLTPPGLTFSDICRVGLPGGDGAILYLRRTINLPVTVHESSEEEWRLARFMIGRYNLPRTPSAFGGPEEPELAFEELFDRFVCSGSRLTELHMCVLDMNSEEKTREAIRTGLIHSGNRAACIRYGKKHGDWHALPPLLFLDMRDPGREKEE